MAIIEFDTNLIGAFLTARTNLRTGTSVPGLLGGPPKAKDRGPAVVPPWQIQAAQRTLAERIAGLRTKKNFIDIHADSVKNSNGDKDSKKLFALYNGLVDLKTVADFAASDLATAGLTKSLDATLQRGLDEVRNYVSKTTFDKDLTLLFGAKANNVLSKATLGNVPFDYVGGVVHVGNRDDPVATLTGTEKFTLKLTRGATTDSIVIDLSALTGPLSLPNVGKFINDQIVAVVDASGAPKYGTRVNVVEVSPGQFALKVKIGAGEQVSLSAADTQPGVVVAGTRVIPGSTPVPSSFVTEFSNLSGTAPNLVFSTGIQAQAPGQTATTTPATPPATSGTTQTTPSAPAPAETSARAVATDSQGNIFVVGKTAGDIGLQFNHSGAEDVFLSKYDSAGNLIFQRLLGASANAEGFSIAIDSLDNVVVAGKTSANLNPTGIIDSVDTFVTKFDNNGNEKFTYQAQAGSTDAGLAVATDANNDIVVTGFIDSGRLDINQTAGGGRDAFLTKLSGVDGSVVFSHQFGGTGAEQASAVAIAADGNILVASEENGNAVLRKFDATTAGTQLYSVTLGALNGGQITDIAVDGTAVYVSGFTSNAALAGSIVNAHGGGTDGFITRIDDAGASASVAFTSYVGGAGDDRIRSITASGGNVFVAGHTDAALPGQTQTGKTDGFIAKFDGTGARQFVTQFGGQQSTFDVNGIAFTAQGSSSLSALGLPSGTLTFNQSRDITRQTSVRPGDSFYVSINGGTKRQITVDAGDSFDTLANKLNLLSFLNIKASTSFSTDGPKLRVEALRGATIEFLPGPDGADALPGLGLNATTLFDEVNPPPDNSSSNKKNPKPKIGGIFGLQLDRGLNLNSKDAAKTAASALDLAAGLVQKAFRSLTFDPASEALKQQLLKQASTGPVPPLLAKQIANFQAALDRLSGGTPNTFGFF